MNHITWKQLKDFCNNLDQKELEKNVWFFEMEEEGKPVTEVATYEDDIYVNINDSDDRGTIEELKQIHEEEFKAGDYDLRVTKGTPYLWSDTFPTKD